MSDSRERKRINSFLAANSADILVTVLALSVFPPGLFEEIGPYASQAVAAGELDRAILIKIYITVLIIGLHALACESKLFKDQRINAEFITRKTLDIGNIFVWTVVAWNMLQIALEVV